MTNRAVRDRLLASTIIAGAIVSGAPAFAQATGTTTGQTSTPPGEQNTQSAGPAEPTSQGDIVVTGTLIKNPALIASAPVQVLGQEEVQLRQTNTAEEILRDLPGAVADVGSAVNNGNGGASFVNLRGLGSQRNLVLLDGNRIVPAGLSGQVDLNNIPLALVQRTEVLTGGASTTYGADAIAGVVNFITRSDFSGVEASVSKQLTGQGDGNYYRADITIGANFDDGRGNAVFSVGYQHSDPVYQGDRKFGQYLIDSFSGTEGGSGTTVPARFNFGTGNKQINPTTGLFGPVTKFFNFNPYNVYQVPFERFNIYGAGHYDVTDDITVYTRGLFSKNTVQTIIAPSGAFGTSTGNGDPFIVPYDNPYLPVGAREQICAANGIAASPTCGTGQTFTTTVGRRAVESGPRLDQFVTQIFDYRAGIRGNITSNLHFDVNGSYGESTNTHNISQYVLLSRFQDALLANNPNTCLSGNAGCIPINAFGDAGSLGGTVNPTGALNYLSATSTASIKTTLGQVRGVISGDFGFHSPFATDSINFAVGGEYRKYTASQTADQLANNGDLGGNNGPINVFAGSYDVTEGFGEILAPLVQDAKFFKSLQIEAGIRYSHYHIFAPSQTANLTTDQALQLAQFPAITSSQDSAFDATTYKGGLTWEPVDGLKFRGVYQHAVRAPNINELFQPPTTTLTTVATGQDPCAGTKPVGNANLTAVCLAQGAPANQIGLIEKAPSANQGSATQYGNLQLRPEKSNSFTLGVVLQPRHLVPGLSVTVDYYNIKINKAISTPTVGDLLAACFNNLSAASATSAACQSIRRNPNDGTFDGGAGFPLVRQNIGRYLTDGIDLGISYRRDLGFAILSSSFEGNWTHRAIFKASALSNSRECVGFYGPNCGLNGGSIQPKFYWNQRTTLTYHNVDLSLLWRHINRVRAEPGLNAYVGALDIPDSPFLNGREVNFNRIHAFNYFDLSGRVSVGEHFEFTLTVQNLLDKQPPLVGGSIGSTLFNSGNTYPSTYDTLGRRFALGAKVKF